MIRFVDELPDDVEKSGNATLTYGDDIHKSVFHKDENGDVVVAVEDFDDVPNGVTVKLVLHDDNNSEYTGQIGDGGVLS